MKIVHESRIFWAETKENGMQPLIVSIHTQYDENIHMISIETHFDDNEMMNWVHPLHVLRTMVKAVEEIAKEHPYVIEKLWFKTTTKRALLYARLFKQKGYDLHYQYGKFYRVKKIQQP